MFLYVLAPLKTLIFNQNRLSKQKLKSSNCLAFGSTWLLFGASGLHCGSQGLPFGPPGLPFGAPGLHFGSRGLAFGAPGLHFGSSGLPFGEYGVADAFFKHTALLYHVLKRICDSHRRCFLCSWSHKTLLYRSLTPFLMLLEPQHILTIT